MDPQKWINRKSFPRQITFTLQLNTISTKLFLCKRIFMQIALLNRYLNAAAKVICNLIHFCSMLYKVRFRQLTFMHWNYCCINTSGISELLCTLIAVGWVKRKLCSFITARIRSVREGNVFSRVCLSVSLSVCLSNSIGGVPCDLSHDALGQQQYINSRIKPCPQSGSGRGPPPMARTRPDQLRSTAGQVGGMP